MYNGRELSDDSQTMQQCGVTPDSMLAMLLKTERPSNPPGGRPQAQNPRSQPQQPQQQQQQQQSGLPNVDPEMIRLQALGNPGALARLRQFDDDLAESVQDSARFRAAWDNAMKARRDLDAARLERQREMTRLSAADDFDIEAQARIEELIREEQVENERLNAHEFYPECKSLSIYFFDIFLTLNIAFGTVHMLYIPVEVNGQTLKAFVDSGAQRTVMSPSCAEKCGVMRLLDKRYGGTAVGVGTAKILGRVHSAQIKIGSLYLPCSFMVVEGKSIDLLLGLDMLKRYQANIDLMKGALVIQGAEVPFLGEADIPREQQEHEQAMLDQAKKAGLAATAANPASSGPSQAAPSTEASSSTANAPGPAQPTSTTGPASFPPADIAKLTDLGASREEAVHLLDITGGNVEQAAGIYLG